MSSVYREDNQHDQVDHDDTGDSCLERRVDEVSNESDTRDNHSSPSSWNTPRRDVRAL